MRIVRVAEQRRMPWKNGGGETAEIAIAPAGAPLDDFDWRVSMARVASDGPFSQFAGVDRTLAVLEGDGIGLTFGGTAERVVALDTPPGSFAGELATTGRLLGGPILDLNVMTRRGRWQHRLTVRSLVGPTPIEPADGGVWIVIATGDPLAIAHAGSLIALARYDAAMIDGRGLPPTGSAAEWRGGLIDTHVTLVPEGVCRAYVIELAPVTSA